MWISTQRMQVLNRYWRNLGFCMQQPNQSRWICLVPSNGNGDTVVREVFYDRYCNLFTSFLFPILPNQYTEQQYDSCDVNVGGGGWLLISYCVLSPKVQSRFIHITENSNTVANVPDFRPGRLYYLASKWSRPGCAVSVKSILSLSLQLLYCLFCCLLGL